ncbi:MAG: ABC transporter ATP-binding protein [Planctomycetota bacterium]
MPLLEVRNLRKRFGRTVAVEDVSFAVEPGEVFGLLGPNGAGKSTSMMITCGLLKADAGEVLVAGRKLTPRSRTLKRELGLAPQELAIYPELTARENLRFFGKLYDMGRRSLADRVGEILDRIGLTARADDPAGTFSGGMKRRLNFGIALLHRPAVVILDEPTVGVDPQSRAHLLEAVRDVASEGVAVVYVSHYMEEVEAVCGRVAIVDGGRVLADDTLSNLLGRVGSSVRLRVDRNGAPLSPHLAGHARYEHKAGGVTELVIERNGADLASTLSAAIEHVRSRGGRVENLKTDEPSLEKLFLQLTGQKLRD